MGDLAAYKMQQLAACREHAAHLQADNERLRAEVERLRIIVSSYQGQFGG